MRTGRERWLTAIVGVQLECSAFVVSGRGFAGDLHFFKGSVHKRGTLPSDRKIILETAMQMRISPWIFSQSRLGVLKLISRKKNAPCKKVNEIHSRRRAREQESDGEKDPAKIYLNSHFFKFVYRAQIPRQIGEIQYAVKSGIILYKYEMCSENFRYRENTMYVCTRRYSYDI